MATSFSNDCPEVHFKHGSCGITLKKGDLMDENDVDVIIIPTPENGQQAAQTYPLFVTLLSKADPHLKDQINKLSSKIKRGGAPKIILTGRPSIILTPTPYFQNAKKAMELLRDTYLACLDLAMSENRQTIAFPTIGCGQSGFSTPDAARTLYNSLINFEQSRNRQFKEIRIVVFKKEIFNEFTEVFIGLGRDKNAKIKFLDISSEKPRTTQMPSKGDDKTAHGRDIREEGKPEYEDDFEDEKHGKQHGSRLNPESAEFHPRDQKSSRGLRRYYIAKTNAELHILQGDILQTKVDVIVNATNESMLGKNGIDGAIHKDAGDDLDKACKAHKEIRPGVRLPTGRSRILLSYKMSRTAHYIINTAGPLYDNHSSEEAKKYLTSCYKTSLALANLYQLKAISFPAISCGQHGYPSDAAAEIALTNVGEYFDSLKMIFFVLDEDNTYDAWVKAAGKLPFLTSMDKSDPDTPSTPKTSTTTNTPKVTEHADACDVPHVKTRSSIITPVHESMSDDIATSVECTADQPPPSSSDRQEAARRVEVDNAGQKKAEKSSTKNNTNQEKTSKDQRSDPPASGKGTQNTKPSGGFGRGKKKRN